MVPNGGLDQAAPIEPSEVIDEGGLRHRRDRVERRSAFPNAAHQSAGARDPASAEANADRPVLDRTDANDTSVERAAHMVAEVLRGEGVKLPGTR